MATSPWAIHLMAERTEDRSGRWRIGQMSDWLDAREGGGWGGMINACGCEYVVPGGGKRYRL